MGIPGSGGEGPSSDMNAFREVFAKARSIVVLSGAGMSAESGVPTFRGAGGYWRTYQAQQLATPESFEENPSLVWEFYSYRREVMGSKHPNPGQMHSTISPSNLLTNLSVDKWVGPARGIRLHLVHYFATDSYN